MDMGVDVILWDTCKGGKVGGLCGLEANGWSDVSMWSLSGWLVRGCGSALALGPRFPGPGGRREGELTGPLARRDGELLCTKGDSCFISTSGLGVLVRDEPLDKEPLRLGVTLLEATPSVANVVVVVGDVTDAPCIRFLLPPISSACRQIEPQFFFNNPAGVSFTPSLARSLAHLLARSLTCSLNDSLVPRL